MRGALRFPEDATALGEMYQRIEHREETASANRG
jgi:hypothetical protein